MSTLNEWLACLLASHELPLLTVDRAVYRRLLAMQERLIALDPSLAHEEGRGLEHVIYAAICGGLRADEAEHGVKFDENTGREIA